MGSRAVGGGSVLVLGAALVGCAPSLRAVAAGDLRCPQEKLEVEGVSAESPHTVRGCGKTATYVYEERCNATYLGASCGGKQWVRRGGVVGE